MTVHKLIERLSELDPNLLVVLSSDEEGNCFSPLERVDSDNLSFDGNEIGLLQLTKQAVVDGYGEEDVLSRGRACVVMFPRD